MPQVDRSSPVSIIYRTIEWIEAHLHDEITVAEMAATAGYSLFHFIRTFDQVIFHTPYDYLIRRRLSEARRDLLAKDCRLLDIALDYRFNNHETFSRAFKRCFGLQPVQWRERGLIPHHSLMPPASLAYLEHLQQPAFSRPQVVEMGARYLSGLVMPLTSAPDALSFLMRNLEGAWPTLSGLDARHFFTVHTYLETGSAFCLAGIEIASPEMAPPLLVTQTLPAGKYVCIQYRGLAAARLPLTLDYFYYTWLPKAGLQPALPMEIFDCGTNTPAPGVTEGGSAVYLPVGLQ